MPRLLKRDLPAFKPDLLLLDVRLSDGSGIEVCRRVQQLDVETKVLVLTPHAADDLVFDAIAAVWTATCSRRLMGTT